MKLHKNLLDDALKNQVSTLQECKESGSTLNRKMDEQAQYLKRNKKLLETSQISMMSTMAVENDIYESRDIQKINHINAAFEKKKTSSTIAI